jgi:hypothetical protein
MSSRLKEESSLAELARQENASPEQILASALALYAALPAAVRSGVLDSLRSPDPGAHTRLINELARALAVHEMRQRRESIRQRVARGELPALPDLPDEEIGAEAVALVKESRRRRAAPTE